MSNVIVWWMAWALILIIAAGLLGRKCTKAKSILAILMDSRGRYSLSQFQIILWTIMVLSLFGGITFARMFHGVDNPMDVTIPNELLILMGISVGTTVLATVIKAGKDINNIEIVKSPNGPKFSQLFLAEEVSSKPKKKQQADGQDTDKENKNTEQFVPIDVTRFQNFWITIIVLVGYVVMSLAVINKTTAPDQIDKLPAFSETLLYLIGISHAGYIGGKIPNRKQPDEG